MAVAIFLVPNLLFYNFLILLFIMEITARQFLIGAFQDALEHGDLIFKKERQGLNDKVFSCFLKNSKEHYTFYVCFDRKIISKRTALNTLSMILKRFNLLFLAGNHFYFSRDFIGQHEKVLAYAYGDENTIFHFFFGLSHEDLEKIEYISSKHQSIVFETTSESINKY